MEDKNFIPGSLDAVFGDISGRADDRPKLLEDLRERLDIIRHKLKFIAARPRVLLIDSADPLLSAGDWVPELVEIAGGEPVLSTAGGPRSPIDPAQIREADPEVIVISPRGFSIQRTLQEIGRLTGLEGWNDLSAVRNGRVYIADGANYLYNPGPGVVDSAEMLAEIIYPKQFIFGHEGTGWVKFG